jgi:hypothetical protein
MGGVRRPVRQLAAPVLILALTILALAILALAILALAILALADPGAGRSMGLRHLGAL